MHLFMLIVWGIVFLYLCLIFLGLWKGWSLEFQAMIVAALSSLVVFAAAYSLQQIINLYLAWRS